MGGKVSCIVVPIALSKVKYLILLILWEGGFWGKAKLFPYIGADALKGVLFLVLLHHVVPKVGEIDCNFWACHDRKLFFAFFL